MAVAGCATCGGFPCCRAYRDAAKNDEEVAQLLEGVLDDPAKMQARVGPLSELLKLLMCGRSSFCRATSISFYLLSHVNAICDSLCL
jgi:hypothetical protein